MKDSIREHMIDCLDYSKDSSQYDYVGNHFLEEILRNVVSFLELKEALKLCRTHRGFNNAANDIFQYSFIMNGMDNSWLQI